MSFLATRKCIVISSFTFVSLQRLEQRLSVAGLTGLLVVLAFDVEFFLRGEVRQQVQ